jgi:hypothetical protein
MSQCQICGREIKLNSNGKIWHHGYQRPGNGWQTVSCLGALYLPYEESSERLQEVIETTQELLQKQIEYLDEFTNNPPDNIKELRGQLRDVRIIVHEKPEDFSPDNPESFRGYSKQYHNRKREIERTIRGMTLELDFLQDRLDAWK